MKSSQGYTVCVISKRGLFKPRFLPYRNMDVGYDVVIDVGNCVREAV